ncbi:claudin-12 [Sinocyclocheilus rhinocerous]|uniref:Claudin 12 n=2 Tax=Cyprininae TaxID=2743694 RepID=A0A673N1V3_9TELE|nr:PREDICTED: claudin-12 [Sinocyclocheilus rhinocerous]XP_016381983.1 PREDICTED: claudin-12 [Sinocyclocheilus rhinocerous]
MSCRDIHATNAFAFIIAMLSVASLTVAMLIPQWRTTRLLTFNRNAKNVTVYDGLWTKCVLRDGSSGCYYFDSDWYAKVDQLDLRLLQFCLPAGLLFSSLALLLCLTGMCKTACCSKTPDDIKNSRCLVNSSGCHLVAGMLLFLGGAIAMPPSVWFLFHTRNLNERYDNLFAVEFGVYVAIGSAGGLILAALLMFMWYCMCKKLPSPFWLPLPEGPAMTNSLSAQPLMTNGLPSPVTYAPQTFPPAVLDAPVFVPAQGYPQPVPTQPMLPHVYMPQMSIPDGYGSEVGASQAYSYAPSRSYASSQGYAPSQSYAPSQRYAGHRYSTRSRMSGIEIDIPVLAD